MADNNNRQPSLRELANERMRERVAAAKAERNASGRPDAPQKRTAEQSQNVQRKAPVNPERRASSQSSASRPSNSENPQRRSASQAEKRPSSQRTASQRPAAKDAIRTERNLSQGNRRPAQSNSHRPSSHSSSGKSASSRSASKKNEKKFPIFWVGLGIYTAILLVLAVIFLGYTDKCLKRYENSQSENYMASYMEDFNSKVSSGSLSSADFTLPDLDLKFVDSDSYINDYISSLGGYSSFTAEKDPTNYITEAPVYNIVADGQTIARVTLKAVSQSKIFAILTIMDWDVDTVEPVCSIDLTNYTFLVPDGYTPVIEGITVDDSYKTGNTEAIPEFAYVSNYVTMPAYVEYKVENVLTGSDIKVLNSKGEEVVCDINGNKIKATYASASNELPEDRKNEALSMIQTYEDFNTSDLTGPSHGLATVQAFLIKDSDYWNMAKQWANGVDITFTSAHTFDNPKYSNVVVDNYAEYSDNCYSVHIAFSKNMVLSRTGEKISNDFDSTVFFVYYDDSDDGVDNPHWCIADMIATTK